MIIPLEQINSDTLGSLIEAFITREGTDYGVNEISLEEKVRQIKSQLRVGDIVVVYDVASESANIMSKVQYEEWVSS